MKVICYCGLELIDSSDHHPHKAWMIPDQLWNGIFDGLDEEVLTLLESGQIRESDASMQARRLIYDAARVLYQCSECGRLYVNDQHGKLHCFLPEDDSVPNHLLRGDGVDA
jgi:hypothetical protein